MAFIITLVSLIIERFFHWTHLRHWRWFDKYQNWLSARTVGWPSYFVLAVCVLPLLIIVAVVYCVLGGWWYGIVKLIFGIVVLLYCIGPHNLWAQTYACLNELQAPDPKIAVDYAQAAFDIQFPDNSQGFHQALTRAVFIEANQRLFAVLFWFVVLGPVGAVLYRLIVLCAKQSDLGVADISMRFLRLLDWIPTRIFTFIFALGGHFSAVFNVWKKNAKKGVVVNDTLLTECGIAALDVPAGNHLPEDGSVEKAALQLLDRVFIMWLVILAVVVLIVK